MGRTINNPDHDIADAAGMERQNLYGWQVERGVTKVVLQNGISGIITEWMGGYFSLDNGKYDGHRSEVVSFE